MSGFEIVAISLIAGAATFWLMTLIFSAPIEPEEDESYGDTTGYHDPKKRP